MLKLLSIKSTQARLGLLIGALVLAAAVNAVLTISQATLFQQQLAELKFLAEQVNLHDEARVTLMKEQHALKSSMLLKERFQEAQGEVWRYQDDLIDYLEETGANLEVDGSSDPIVDLHDSYVNEGVSLLESSFDQDGNINEEKMVEGFTRVDEAAATLESQILERASGARLDYDDQLAVIRESAQNSTLYGQVALAVLGLLVVVGVFAADNISRPIQALISSIVAFENGIFRSEMLANQAKRTDDLGQLSLAVSSMAQSITDQQQMTRQFLQAAQRFVPAQYLDFLQKDNITKVRLGDHVDAEMAVMFSDIRGFTSMSERMTAKENFDFINEYLKLVSPIINRYEGFIVKFLGDGMMAIFPYGVGDAVQAGVEKQKLVQAFNETLRQRGMGNITVGIGVHTGKMMVGMIGEELRMQGDAFSDNVNLTSRIEGLNKFFGTSMLISEDTLNNMAKPVKLKMRYLGKVVVKGRIDPLAMYEVYDGLSPEVQVVKDSLLEDFQCGLELYAAGRFNEAGHFFEKVLQRDPADKAARYYLESCADLHEQPLPANWSGVIVMTDK